jgi:aspartyl-tRNA(Asn)/glutamyl-tRNA(Gln) amidotransferase subunit C
MKIEVTDQLVEHIARLSRLAQSPEDRQEMKSHFRKILQFIEELEELDTRDVDPSLFSLDASNIYREDERWESLPRDEALAIAPAAEPPYFVVPQIVGEELAEGGA